MERERYLADNKKHDLTTWIAEKLRTSRDETGYTFNMGNNKLVCLRAWCSILGISSHKLKVAMESQGFITVHGSFGIEREPEWKTYLRGKLTQFFAVHTDTHPTSNRLFLPPTLTKTEVYELFVPDFTNKNLPLSYSSFMAFWKEEFSHVSTPAYVSMGKCDTCLLLAEEKRKLKTNGEKQAWKSRRDSHTYLHTHARNTITNWAIQSEQEPWKSMHISFDGKQPSRLPHITSIPKSTQLINRLKLEVIGMMNTAEKTKQYYLSLGHWSHDPNLTVTILYDHLIYHYEKVNISYFYF